MQFNYIPERGDLIYLQKAREHWRPAIVISASEYNQKVGYAVVVAISGKVKSNPFEIEIKGQDTDGKEIGGQVALADHLQILDLQAGKARAWGKLDESVMAQISEYVKAVLGL